MLTTCLGLQTDFVLVRVFQQFSKLSGIDIHALFVIENEVYLSYRAGHDSLEISVDRSENSLGCQLLWPPCTKNTTDKIYKYMISSLHTPKCRFGMTTFLNCCSLTICFFKWLVNVEFISYQWYKKLFNE